MKYSKEQLSEVVKESLSIAECLRKLNLRPVGGNYKTFQSLITKHKIDTSHFTGKAWNKGLRYRHFGKCRKDEEVFIKNSPHRSTYSLKKRLLNYREKVCEICKNSKWLDKEIPLEIHHINGVNTDNRFENLQILCPNCHALTDNYRGRNSRQSALSEKRDVEYRKVRECLTDNAEENPELSLIKTNKESAESRHGKPKSKKEKPLVTCLY